MREISPGLHTLQLALPIYPFLEIDQSNVAADGYFYHCDQLQGS